MKKRVRIAPSLLSADFSEIGRQTEALGKAGCEYLHLDVMDGIFVPNISFGQVVVRSLRPCSKLIFDTHLMITDPERYIKAFADAGADIITVHAEACPDPAGVLRGIRALGKKAGISLKPATPTSAVIPLLEYADLVLVMTVEPGFGGQKFMADMLPKIRELREAIDLSGREIILECDGGIDILTAPRAAEAGADLLVAGSSVFRGDEAANFLLRTAAANAG